MVLVSVVILNYNGKHFLRACIDALQRQTLQDFEILLVDNASTDGSAEFVEARYPDLMSAKRLRVIRNKTNVGFAEGNNVGHRAARGEYVVLLNNDTKVSPRWLEKLVEAMRLPSWRGKRVMIAGGLWGDRGSRERMRGMVERRKRTFTINLCGEVVYAPQRADERGRRVVTSFYAVGLSEMYRRKEFRAPFDGDYFINAEDVQQCWLSHLRGGIVVMALDAWVAHYGGGAQRDIKAINRLAVFHGTKNQIINYLTFYEKKNLLRIAPLMLVTQCAHVVQNPRKLLVKMKAYWWILRNLGRIMRKRKAIQSQRKVPDREIIKEMSSVFYNDEMAALLSGRGVRGISKAVLRALNALFSAYCWAVRLRTREFCDT